MFLAGSVVIPPDGGQLAVVFLLIFLLNIIPAFAPPTWVVLSAFSVSASSVNPFTLSLTGAAAATLGRMVLAKLARIIVRGQILNEHARKNVDEIRVRIEAHGAVCAAGLALFALSPLPSNHLFIAYGLTDLRIAVAAAPFFFGRFASYLFWTTSAVAAGRKFDLDMGDAVIGVGIYFVVTQLLIVPFVYLFVKIDWNALFVQGRFRIRPHEM